MKEPLIAVGLLESNEPVNIRLHGDFKDAAGRRVPSDMIGSSVGPLHLKPVDPQRASFSLEATIGICFHWQQRQVLTFRGGLRLVPRPGGGVTVINDVPLETYLESVVCSEMRSSSPPELVKAHAIISRSWSLAQLEPSDHRPGSEAGAGRIIRWTDRTAHAGYDFCADDHCQRYQGIGRIESPSVLAAVKETRGLVLSYRGKPCDARFSKCCGGMTEDFTTAWGNEPVPYLVPVFDGPGDMPAQSPREFIENPPDVYCGCRDEKILELVLNPYDLETRDFFRWQVRLGAEEAGELVRQKLGVSLGRIVALEAVARGASGRLKLLRLRGERDSLLVGKELEIRRALSDTHLYSSAFVVDTEGPGERPKTFILTGAGWGHGVGLCQIGAAVMAHRGYSYKDILNHYYPGTMIEKRYG